MSYYDYKELREKALSPDATQADVDALGEWFSRFGERYWNGEFYDADDGREIRPVYKWDEELDQGEIVGYELR